MAKTQTKNNNQEFSFFTFHFSFLKLSREVLYQRHRLSHQQIDLLLDEEKSGQYLPELLAQMEQLGEFLRITDALKEAMVSFVSLKGPLLSQRIHNDPTRRLFNDFDFLIEPGQIEKTIAILVNLGYESDYFSLPVNNCKRSFLLKNINEMILSHPEKRTNIEIHWRLFSGRNIKAQTLTKIILENLTEITLSGRTFKVFNPEFELVFLTIHGSLHGFRRLKWLLDIRDFLDRVEFDESLFLDLAKKLKALPLASLTNSLLKHFFPGSKLLPVTKAARKSQVHFCLQEISTETDEETKSVRVFLKRFFYALGAFPGFRFKLSVIKNNFLATDSINCKYIPCIPILYFLIGPFWKLLRGFR